MEKKKKPYTQYEEEGIAIIQKTIDNPWYQTACWGLPQSYAQASKDGTSSI